MKISDNLADLNYKRFQSFKPPFDLGNAKQAALVFNGDTYVGLQAQVFDEKDFSFAQDHLRILSGLYGILSPLDLIQPYRLEMGAVSYTHIRDHETVLEHVCRLLLDKKKKHITSDHHIL